MMVIMMEIARVEMIVRERTVDTGMGTIKTNHPRGRAMGSWTLCPLCLAAGGIF
jgi:hypothetical protein